MATGYLIIQARTAHDALPLNGVQIALETLDAALPLNPDFSGTPFISYGVLAFADGFNSVHIVGIPILDGEA